MIMNDQTSLLSAGVSTLDNASTKPLLSMSPYNSEDEDDEDDDSILNNDNENNNSLTSNSMNSATHHRVRSTNDDDDDTDSDSDNDSQDDTTDSFGQRYNPSTKSTALTSIDPSSLYNNIYNNNAYNTNLGGGGGTPTIASGGAASNYVLFNPGAGSNSQSIHYQQSVYSTGNSIHAGSFIGINSSSPNPQSSSTNNTNPQSASSPNPGTAGGASGIASGATSLLHYATTTNIQDSASVITIASSTRNRRRRSIDTNASTVAIPPASLFERSVHGTTTGTVGSIHGVSGGAGGRGGGQREGGLSVATSGNAESSSVSVSVVDS
ncbi:unnamed protein product [Ambrosiozyma monospora]|uniref:Unnamed protein product n=1 Tax=Ambrosiozyma monospora TaxID=43982 RepID=A0ACB5SX50_AMBMO|nr:unnamed protein product [Ambrosiozyma monospora]